MLYISARWREYTVSDDVTDLRDVRVGMTSAFDLVSGAM